MTGGSPGFGPLQSSTARAPLSPSLGFVPTVYKKSKETPSGAHSPPHLSSEPPLSTACHPLAWPQSPPALRPSLLPLRGPGSGRRSPSRSRAATPNCQAQSVRPSRPGRPLPPLHPQPSAGQRGRPTPQWGKRGPTRAAGNAELARPAFPSRLPPPPHLVPGRCRVQAPKDARRTRCAQPLSAVPLRAQWWAPHPSVLRPQPLRNQLCGTGGSRSNETPMKFAVGTLLLLAASGCAPHQQAAQSSVYSSTLQTFVAVFF